VVKARKLPWTALLAALVFAGFQLGEAVHLHEHLEVDLVDHDAALPATGSPCADGSHVEPLVQDHHRACPACLALCSGVTLATPGPSPGTDSHRLARHAILPEVPRASRARRRRRGRAPPLD